MGNMSNDKDSIYLYLQGIDYLGFGFRIIYEMRDIKMLNIRLSAVVV